MDSTERKDRQLVFLLVGQIADAQFQRGDRQRSERLWQEAAALALDPDRIIALLYGGHDPGDRPTLEALDAAYLSRWPARRRSPWGWAALRPPHRGGGHRSAPPAAPRARRAAH